MERGKKFLPTLVFITCVSTVAMAEDSKDKTPGSGPNPFSDCGIGAALFPNTKWAAVTSNIIWDIGTTAVTSATMSPETCSGKQVAAALFIRDTHTVLTEDIARGGGKHLTTALNLFECGVNWQDAAIWQIRSEMSTTVAKDGYRKQTSIQKAADLYEVMNNAVEATCKA